MILARTAEKWMVSLWDFNLSRWVGCGFSYRRILPPCLLKTPRLEYVENHVASSARSDGSGRGYLGR
jgi:hypothetical protein